MSVRIWVIGIFTILGLVIVAAGNYVWTRQHHQPGLYRRIVALFLLELAIVLLILSFFGHFLFAVLSLILFFASIVVLLSVTIQNLRRRSES